MRLRATFRLSAERASVEPAIRLSYCRIGETMSSAGSRTPHPRGYRTEGSEVRLYARGRAANFNLTDDVRGEEDRETRFRYCAERACEGRSSARSTS